MGELRHQWGIAEPVFPGPEIARLWKSVPPEDTIPPYFLNKITTWLAGITGPRDYVVIQGEFGISFYVVQWCYANSRIPIYATSHRKMKEIIDKEKIISRREFQHVNFRQYPVYSKRDIVKEEKEG